MKVYLPIALAIILLISACVAPKANTVNKVNHTLKGDNTTTEALTGSMKHVDSGFGTLGELTDQFAEDFADQFKEKKKLFLDRANIRDAQTQDIASFSAYLENELEASLSRQFHLVYDEEEADYMLGAVFQGYGNMIRIFFKYHNADFSVRKSMDYSIERIRLPKDSLKENLRSKAAKLAGSIIGREKDRKIYFQPVELGSCNCVSDFSRSFSTLIKTEIVKMYRTVEIIDNKPIPTDQPKAAVKSKKSQTRSLAKKAKNVKNLETSDAYFADADANLEGSYYVNGDTVTVSLMLKDLNGRILNSASVDIDTGMIHTRLDNKEVEILSDIADTTTEKNDNMVKISTNKGSKQPLFHNGENVTFIIQAAKPLYIYIYSVSKNNHVELLYPDAAEGMHKMLYPGQLHTIPDIGDDWEITVEPPFGVELVKIFASPIQLPIPTMSKNVASKSFRGQTRSLSKRKKVQKELAKTTAINPKDLVDYYRGLQKRFQTEILEDSLVVETKM
jgi:hypothetical protein